MIKLANVTKLFGNIAAVNDVSFEIGDGEIVGLLGPNGAGKSTRMRLITGFLPQDSGTITVNDLDIIKSPVDIKKEIGYLPENNPLYLDMLTVDFLRFCALAKGVEKDFLEDELIKIVKETGIAEVYYRPINELSKGFRQRVGLAQALLGDPKVLILDEPTEGLDPNQRVEIRNLIKELGKKRTVIVSTHVMQEVTAICTRIIIINRGKIVADGPADSISLSSSDTREYKVTLSGGNVGSLLQNVSSVKKIKEIIENGNRHTVVLSTKKESDFPIELSEICKRYNLIIWELIEEKKDLEDMFRELTQ